MDFQSGAELLALCGEYQCPISAIMKRRECSLGEPDQRTVTARMRKAWEIMKESASSPITSPRKSIGGPNWREAPLSQ